MSLLAVVCWAVYDRLHPALPEAPSSGRVFRELVPVASVNPGPNILPRFKTTMVLRKWNKVFVRTEPNRGIEMLIVEKLPWADTVMPDISYCSFLWDQLDHHAHLPALVCGELICLPKSIEF